MRFSQLKYYFLFNLSFAILFFTNSIVGQSISKQQILQVESEELSKSNPNEALKIALLLLKSSSSEKEKARLNFLIAKIYKIKGDYNNAAIHLFDAAKNPENLSIKDIILVDINKVEILRDLYLDNQSNKYLEEAVTKLPLLKDSKDFSLINATIVLEKVRQLLDRQHYNEALKLIQKNNVEKNNVIKGNTELLKLYNLTVAKIYCGLGDYEKGSFYYSQIPPLLERDKERDNYTEAYYLNGLATVYFHKKEYNAATEKLSKALLLSKNIENLYLTEYTYKQLVLNYLALNDGHDYKSHNTDFLKVGSELENNEQESVNTIYNLINQEYEAKYELKRQSYNNKLYVFIGFFLLILAGSFFFWYKVFSNRKRLKEIINYLEVTRKNLVIKPAEKVDVVNKKVFIPVETEQSLLSKLKRFEGTTKFTNKEMSLAVLAGQFDTNTKYLSEVINKHYNVNFNVYINKLRINFIVGKLKTDPNFMNYKISYLAEVSGFSSHSSFATIFKSITGIAPITFIELLKKEIAEGNTLNDDYEEE